VNRVWKKISFNNSLLPFSSALSLYPRERGDFIFFHEWQLCASVLVVDEKQVEKNSIILTFHIRRWINIFLTIQAHERWENHNNIPTRTFTHKQSREKYCTLRKLLILVRTVLSMFLLREKSPLASSSLARKTQNENFFTLFFLWNFLCVAFLFTAICLLFYISWKFFFLFILCCLSVQRFI
jgi:hypothetical protein